MESTSKKKRVTLKSTLLCCIAMCILLVPIVSALKSTADVEIPYNFTINLSNNVMLVFFNEELILTHNLLGNSTETYKNIEGIYETSYDNRIFITTTQCNTTLLVKELSNLTGDIREYMTEQEILLAEQLEPLTSLQGRLDSKQRDYDECLNDLRYEKSNHNSTKTQLGYAQKLRKSASTAMWTAIIGMMALLGIVTLFIFKIIRP